MTARSLRPPFAVGLLACGLVTCALACSSGDFTVADTTGDVGAGDDTVDAPASDVTASDTASVDVGPADVTVSSDARVDGASDAFVRRCDTVTHAFCADFDGMDYKEGFTSAQVANNGALGTDGDAVSPPKSFTASTSAGVIGALGDSVARVFKRFDGRAPNAAPIRVAFDVKTDYPLLTPDGELELLAVQPGDQPPVSVVLRPKGKLVVLGIVAGTPIEKDTLLVLPKDAWARVIVTVTFAPDNTGSVSVRVDALEPVKVAFPNMVATPTATSFFVGSLRRRTFPATTVRFDNVYVDFIL